jgi:hypothetical protein
MGESIDFLAGAGRMGIDKTETGNTSPFLKLSSCTKGAKADFVHEGGFERSRGGLVADL